MMFLLCMVLMLGFTLQSFLIVPSNDWKWILSTSTVHQNPDEHLAKNNCSQTAGPGSLKAGKNLVDLGSAVPGQPLPTDEGGMERWQSRVLNGLPTAFFRGEILQMGYSGFLERHELWPKSSFTFSSSSCWSFVLMLPSIYVTRQSSKRYILHDKLVQCWIQYVDFGCTCRIDH